MSWFHQNQAKRPTPVASIEGLHMAMILREEPDLAKAKRQEEYDRSISKVTVSKLLPSLKEIDIRADRAAYTRAIQSGFNRDEAMDIVTALRNRRDRERGENAALRAKVKQAMEAKK